MLPADRNAIPPRRRAIADRIIFVPGKNPKPPAAAHRAQLWRCLLRGVEQVDAGAAAALRAHASCFELVAWNRLYYASVKPLAAEDLRWIDVLLDKSGPSDADRREALSWRHKTAWLSYTLGDYFPLLIDLIPDPAVKSTIQETARYFENTGGIGAQVRELLKAPLRAAFAAGERVLLIAHSMGSVIAFDALWELSREEGNPGRVDLLLTLGSPLGMRFVQKRLRNVGVADARRYPANVRRWINVAAEGDLTALDTHLAGDFAAMRGPGLTESIADEHAGVFNYFRDANGLNVHRSYGYLVNPRVGRVIAGWWRAQPYGGAEPNNHFHRETNHG